MFACQPVEKTLDRCTRLLRRVGLARRASGEWDVLEAPDNRPRYHALERLRMTYAPGAPVLDLGCGVGHVLPYLTTRVPYLGIDISPEAIQEARRRHPGRCFVCGSITDLTLRGPLPFGVLLFNEVLYYQPTVDAALEVFAEYTQGPLAPAFAIVSIWINPSRPDQLNHRIWDRLIAANRHRSIAEENVTFDATRYWALAIFAIRRL